MKSAITLDRLLYFRAPGRMVNVRPDDTLLVSYPRSGTTWTSFLITAMIHRRPPDFVTINSLLPDIYGARRIELSRMASPRLLKSHEYFDPRYRRVIYLVRDPRDVVLSYHDFQQRKRLIPESCPLSSYVERFVAGGLDRFGTWREHAGSWLGARSGRSDFLLVRYEDLRSVTVAELRRIADFIGLDADDARLALAAEQCSIAAMRRLEHAQAEEGAIDRRRFDRPGVRSGLAGGWRNLLDRELEAKITAAFHPLMRDLGYLEGSLGRVAPGAGPSDVRIRQSGS